MQRLFYSLVNGSFGDPGLYLELGGDAVLFDCGDLRPLSAPRVHRVREVALSHAHVDHVFGLDWLFRLFLGNDRRIRIFGPEGIADRVASKLDGYTWNISLDFTFDAEVVELDPAAERGRVSRIRLRNGVERALRTAEVALPEGVFVDDRRHRLRAVEVDHGTPCLAFGYEQKRGVRVRDADIDRLGLPRGEWIRDLKGAVLEGIAPGAELEVDGRRHSVERLAAELTEVVPGRRVAYVTDTILTPAVRERVVGLARGADVFFCESKFVHRDRDRALAARHLTALEAAGLARDAGVGELVLFHPSPRYEKDFGEVLGEARTVFPAARFQEEVVAELTGA